MTVMELLLQFTTNYHLQTNLNVSDFGENSHFLMMTKIFESVRNDKLLFQDNCSIICEVANNIARSSDKKESLHYWLEMSGSELCSFTSNQIIENRLVCRWVDQLTKHS